MKTQYTFIDSHAHIQFPAYDQDREAVVARALEAGIGMVNVGTQCSTSADAVSLAERSADGVWATVGFHPGHIGPDAHHDPQELRERHHEDFDVSMYRSIARHPKVVAIGECGLDYAVFVRKRSEREQKRASADLSAKASASAGASGEGGLPSADTEHVKHQQQEVFLQHIELAHEVGRPLVIHCRQAFVDLIKLLDSRFQILNSPAGVVHFFSGSWDDAKQLLDLGFYLGFGGVITFARDYDEVVKKAPLDRLLVETDAPYVAPVPHRGKRNEPAYIIETVKKIAELRQISYDEVARATTVNAANLFGI